MRQPRTMLSLYLNTEVFRYFRIKGKMIVLSQQLIHHQISFYQILNSLSITYFNQILLFLYFSIPE
jgi:hypothetical protein